MYKRLTLLLLLTLLTLITLAPQSTFAEEATSHIDINLKNTMIDIMQPITINLILTTNNYKMYRTRTVYNPITFEPMTYANYEEFRNDMLAKSTLDH